MHHLDRSEARQVALRLERAASDPDHYFSRLAGSDEYKLRVGAFRLLALISHRDQTIIVERVEHRSRIYDRRG